MTQKILSKKVILISGQKLKHNTWGIKLLPIANFAIAKIYNLISW